MTKRQRPKINLKVKKVILRCQDESCLELFEHYTKSPKVKKKFCDRCIARRKREAKKKRNSDMKKLLGILCIAGLLWCEICGTAVAYTPEEARQIYKDNGCSLVEQTRDKFCTKCQPTPHPECKYPIDIQVLTHWKAEWDGLPDCVEACPDLWDRAADGSCMCDDVTEPTPAPVVYVQDENGQIDIPATAYNSIDNKEAHQWIAEGQYMVASPDSGTRYDDVTLSSKLTYKIRFTQGGQHFLWVLGGFVTASSDSLHYGVDNAKVGDMTFLDRTWSNDQQTTGARATLDVQAGDYDLNIWMREDGSKFANILITNDPNFRP
jgi:hypothetical protein